MTNAFKKKDKLRENDYKKKRGKFAGESTGHLFIKDIAKSYICKCVYCKKNAT
jgi:hypothetical protein